MHRLSQILVLILLCSSSYAANLDDYVDALDWREKWEKVISRVTDNYINKNIANRLSGLPQKKQKLITNKLKDEMSQAYSWRVVGTNVMQDLVDTCGTDLLDKFVDFYSGVKFSPDERQKISSAYRVCGKTAVERSMSVIYSDSDGPFNPKKSEKSLNRTIGDIIINREKAFASFRDKYLSAKGHKAFAQSDSGNWNWRSNRTSKEHAIHSALASCRARNLEFEKTQPCRVINLNDKWSDIYRQSIVSEQSGESAIMSNKALNAYRQKYLDITRDKAFAQSDNGAWSWRSSKTSESDAVKKALAACRKNNKNHDEVFPCRIINVNNSWRGS